MWQKLIAWQRRLHPWRKFYLGFLLSLGLLQGIISIIVLLLSPSPPAGSR